MLTANHKIRKLPPWLRRPLPAGETYAHTRDVLASLGLETICDNANCPNRGECWARGTATVLILGNICTRSCGFCSLAPAVLLRKSEAAGAGKPAPPDPTEPARIAEMAKQMRLKYLVITSVNRDDLPDGGAGHFRDCINKVRQQWPDTNPPDGRRVKFEILTPDFRNCQRNAIEILRDALPFVFAHNVETVPSLYPMVRAGGDYQRSLNLLRRAKETYAPVQTKSSIMLGLGETDAEVEQVMEDLRDVGCDRITIGQYLRPSPAPASSCRRQERGRVAGKKNSLEVVEYITPAEFDWWGEKAVSLGFSWVSSAPFARSSYFAERESTL